METMWKPFISSSQTLTHSSWSPKKFCQLSEYPHVMFWFSLTTTLSSMWHISKPGPTYLHYIHVHVSNSCIVSKKLLDNVDRQIFNTLTKHTGPTITHGRISRLLKGTKNKCELSINLLWISEDVGPPWTCVTTSLYCSHRPCEQYYYHDVEKQAISTSQPNLWSSLKL